MAAGFSFDTCVQLVIRNTRDRLLFATIYAIISLLIHPWLVCAIWLGTVFFWDLVVRPGFDRLTANLPPSRAITTYAAANAIGSGLYQGVSLLALADGSALGVAIAATWLTGGFMSNFIYFGANRRLLVGVLGPAIVVALVGPFLAFGARLDSLVISVLILLGLLSARSFSLDHHVLLRTLADRQTALSDVERKLALAVEASGDGLFEYDILADVLRPDAAWLAILGYKPEHLEMLLSNGWRDLLHPDDIPALEPTYEAHFRGDTPHTNHEHRVLCRDGSYKWVLSRGQVIERTADGRPHRVVGTMMDLSARKALEQQLEAARDLAESANHAKGVFLANMSHEIRTPLNGVIGTAGALARRPLPAEEREMVGLIQTSGQTLDRLLSDILDQAKIEAGRFELLVAPFDLRNEIEAAAELMRAKADEKAIDFRVVYADAARGMFAGDAVRIRQIVSNLASNAIKFTNAGEVRIQVGCFQPTAAEARSRLRIEVIDTGIGFDAEAAKRLFTRFTQADGSISRQFGGTGLGLSISRTLADLMGGEIQAASEPGKGSTFTIDIPLARTMALADYDADQASGKGYAEPVVETTSMAKLRVLLAEDHPTNQRVVQLILEPAGVALTIVGNGLEAVGTYHPGLFDLILMDMQMPVMDGLSATREIRRRERELGLPPIPIAMLTANAMGEHRSDAAAAGADHLIAKPITPDSLIAGVEYTLLRADAACAERRTGLG
ncbi:MAG TPA: ATP-binding protein [Phenylobacterium sp.]